MLEEKVEEAERKQIQHSSLHYGYPGHCVVW